MKIRIWEKLRKANKLKDEFLKKTEIKVTERTSEPNKAVKEVEKLSKLRKQPTGAKAIFSPT